MESMLIIVIAFRWRGAGTSYLHPAIWKEDSILPLSRVVSLLLTVRVFIARVGVLHRVDKVVVFGDLSQSILTEWLISFTPVLNS